MTGRETTVLILLDAFRWDYLSAQDTPTLWATRQRALYVRRIRPSLGFCERTEILTGTYPNISGNFAAIGYDPPASPYRRLFPVLRLFTPLDRFRRIRPILRRLVTHVLRRLGVRMPVFQIPFDQLRFFALTEDRRDHFGAGAFAVESLIDVMQSAGRRTYAGAFTAVGVPNGDDENRIRLAMAHIPDEYDLYLVYLGEPDRVGHRFGPDSAQRWATARTIDAQFHRLKAAFEDHFDKVHWLVLGDHGMVPVKCHVDAGSIVHSTAQRFGLMPNRDYRVFLDSTMVRVWALSSRSHRPLVQALAAPALADTGRLIAPPSAADLHIPVPGGLYGDLIWWGAPGTLVFPDYFHVVQPARGMHGYDPSLPESQGMALVLSPHARPRELDEADLIDVCPTLCDLMGLRRYPAQNQGASLWKR
jgi:predicted AlkP superfamily pyrophosphatase or phosphodiesterase